MSATFLNGLNDLWIFTVQIFVVFFESTSFTLQRLWYQGADVRGHRMKSHRRLLTKLHYVRTQKWECVSAWEEAWLMAISNSDSTWAQCASANIKQLSGATMVVLSSVRQCLGSRFYYPTSFLQVFFNIIVFFEQLFIFFSCMRVFQFFTGVYLATQQKPLNLHMNISLVLQLKMILILTCDMISSWNR